MDVWPLPPLPPIDTYRERGECLGHGPSCGHEHRKCFFDAGKLNIKKLFGGISKQTPFPLLLRFVNFTNDPKRIKKEKRRLIKL